MAPVLDLDPAVEPAGAIEAIAVLGDQTFQPHQADVAEQIRTDLALLEWCEVNAVHAPRQRQRQLADVVTVADQHVELTLEAKALRGSRPNWALRRA